MNTPSFTCAVVDDHPALVEAIVAALEEHDVQVVGRAADGESGLALIRELRPRVAIVDVRMPRLSGVEVAREVARTVPETGVALYTGYGDRALLVEALDAGARGFILKEAPLDDLIRALRAVEGGGTYIDPVLAAQTLRNDASQRPVLTARELDALRLLAEGCSHEAIAEQLTIGVETVRTHLRKASDKLGAATRTQAVASALRFGLIQ